MRGLRTRTAALVALSQRTRRPSKTPKRWWVRSSGRSTSARAPVQMLMRRRRDGDAQWEAAIQCRSGADKLGSSVHGLRQGGSETEVKPAAGQAGVAGARVAPGFARGSETEVLGDIDGEKPGYETNPS